MRAPSRDSHCWAMVLVFLQSLVTCRTGAEVPSIDYLFPSGGKQGSMVNLSVGGKLEPWPLRVWIDRSGLVFKTNEAKGKFTVEISTNAPIGPHLVRFYNPDGASAPRCFIVGQIEEQSEKEPNDRPDKAQVIEKLPVTINGRFDKADDSDSFAVPLKEGQWLVASVDAYSMDSPVDPLLYLLDIDGAKLAFNHDGRSLDPLLVYRAEKTGTYLLQLAAFAYPPKSEVRFTGGDPAVYRLNLSCGPMARFAYPLGVQRGRKAALHIFGWNLGTSGHAISHEFDASRLDKHANQAVVSLPEIQNRLGLPLSEHPEAVEIEPNDSLDLAQLISIPCAISGRIGRPGDEDRFGFQAKKNDRFLFRVESGSLGFPLDALMKVEERTGKELARSDDSGRSADPELSWNAPADGTYSVVLGDLIQRGGDDFLYRLQMIQPQAAAKVVIESNALRLEAGKTVDLKVNVARLYGFASSVLVVADELPEGVTGTAANAPAKGGEVVIRLAASENAKGANQPIRVLAIQPDLDTPQVQVALVNLKGQNTAAGEMLINQTEKIWLTVIAKNPSNSKEEDKSEQKPR